MNKREYPFIDFCIDFAEKYNTISNGEYKSDDGKFTIIKEHFSDIYGASKVNCSNGIVRVNDNLNNLTFSGILFFICWAFIRFKCCNNIEADQKTLDLLKKCGKFSIKDGLIDFLKILRETANNYNLKRAGLITKG